MTTSLQEKIIKIVEALNATSESMSARQIVEKYYVVTSYNDSNVLTVGQILNVMTHLGLVRRHTTYTGKNPRHKFERKGNNLITMES